MGLTKWQKNIPEKSCSYLFSLSNSISLYLHIYSGCGKWGEWVIGLPKFKSHLIQVCPMWKIKRKRNRSSFVQSHHKENVAQRFWTLGTFSTSHSTDSPRVFFAGLLYVCKGVFRWCSLLAFEATFIRKCGVQYCWNMWCTVLHLIHLSI